MAFLVYGLFALSKEGKTPRKDKKEWNKTMFGLMQLRRFWAITSINTAKPCHSFLSLFHAKHRAAGDQWPVQLLYSSFVSPPHWKRNRAFISLILSHIFTHFPPQISYPPSTCFSIPVSYPMMKTFSTTFMMLLFRYICPGFSSHFFLRR